MSFLRQFAETLVIFQCAKINNFILAKRQRANRSARCQKQFFVGVSVLLVIGDGLVVGIDGLHSSSEMEIELLRFGVAPNTLQRFTFPKRFGQRRTIVRRVGFGTYESYAAFKIDFANAMHGSVSSHSAADN